MVRKPFRVLVVGLALAFGQPIFAAGNTLSTFTTEKEAKDHCPKDTVVWLNLKTGVYHLPGTRWYGNTKQGAFACMTEANAAGDRAAASGQ